MLKPGRLAHKTASTVCIAAASTWWTSCCSWSTICLERKRSPGSGSPIKLALDGLAPVANAAKRIWRLLDELLARALDELGKQMDR